MAKEKSLISRKHKCECCGTYGNWRNPVTYGKDPYEAEINDDYTKIWLCKNCIEDKQGDI